MNGQVSGQKPLIHHSFHSFVHSTLIDWLAETID